MNTPDERPRSLREPDADNSAGISRGGFLRRAGLGIGTVAVVGAGGLGYRAYDQGVFQAGQGLAYAPWSDWKQHAGLLPLVGAAILAPNPRNSQAWLFRLGPNRVDLFADGSRNIGAIDPYAREKHAGLGAALENLVLAAQTVGFASTDGGFRPTPWGGEFRDYQTVNGVRMPASADVYRELPEGRLGYWSATVTSAVALEQPFPDARPAKPRPSPRMSEAL